MSDFNISLKFKAVNMVTKPVQQISRAMKGFKRHSDESNRSVMKLGKVLTAHQTRLIRLRTAQEKLNRAQDNFQRSMATAANTNFAGSMVSGVGRRILNPLVGATRNAAEFEYAMAKVKAVSRASASELASLSKQAKELGITTSFSAHQAAEGQAFLAMAGFHTNDILSAMPGLLDLAKAGNIELGRASDIASNILSGFNIEATEMTRVSDVLAATMTSSNVNLEMLGDTLKYVAPLAREVGLSLEETAAMTGLLGNAGIQGTMAGTAMRAMLNRLSAPASAANDMLRSLQVTVKDASGDLRAMPDILTDVLAATKGMGSADRLKVLKELFGEEAISGAAVLIDQQNFKSIDAFAERLREAGGASRAMAAIMEETSKGKVIELGSALSGLALSIGSFLLPFTNRMSSALTWLARNLTTLTDKYPKLSAALAYTVGGLGVLLVVIGSLIITAGSFIASLGFMKLGIAHVGLAAKWASVKLYGFRFAAMAMTGLKSVIAIMVTLGSSTIPFLIGAFSTLSAAIMAIPVFGWIIAAITLVVFLIYKYWTPIKKFMIRLWENISDGLIAAWDWIVAKVKAYIDWIVSVAKWVKEQFSWFFDDEDEKGKTLTSVTKKIEESSPAKKVKRSSSKSSPIRKTTAITSAALAAAIPVAAASTEPVTPITRQASAQTTINAPINIQTHKGMDEREVANQVARALDERERKAESAKRRRFYD